MMMKIHHCLHSLQQWWRGDQGRGRGWREIGEGGEGGEEGERCIVFGTGMHRNTGGGERCEGCEGGEGGEVGEGGSGEGVAGCLWGGRRGEREGPVAAVSPGYPLGSQHNIVAVLVSRCWFCCQCGGCECGGWERSTQSPRGFETPRSVPSCSVRV